MLLAHCQETSRNSGLTARKTEKTGGFFCLQASMVKTGGSAGALNVRNIKSAAQAVDEFIIFTDSFAGAV